MTAPPTLESGMIIANRFRLDRQLGQGGMGSVWVAWHLTLHIEVAIKFIDPQYVANRDAWSRFNQEAMAAAKIKSPHVVSVLDFGTDEHHRPYLAMELLQGEELASLLEREPVLPVPTVARIITQACKGLARAHAARIIHRDIKPDNLFLCEDEDGFLLKILDFGIAKMGCVGGSAHRTGTGQVLGTPLYMSPEQAYGNRPVDHRSDLYSLAVVAYRCLTGYVPFQSDGVGELIVAITTQLPRPPSHLRAGLPPGLDPWFQRALAKDPELRFRNAKEMADTFAVACGMAPSVESTAQFSALNAADLTGPLCGSFSETPADVVPLVRRGFPSSPPSSRRQAVTLQGTATSFFHAEAHASRVRWLIAGAVFLGLGVGGGILWRLNASSPTPLASAVASAPHLDMPVASTHTLSPSVTSAVPTASEAVPTSSELVVSINSLPSEQPYRPLPQGTGFRPVPRVSAPKSAIPMHTAPASAAPGPAAAPASTKHDYGL